MLTRTWQITTVEFLNKVKAENSLGAIDICGDFNDSRSRLNRYWFLSPTCHLGDRVNCPSLIIASASGTGGIAFTGHFRLFRG
jgi:hypothetical protein